jgi:hypothetical protein
MNQNIYQNPLPIKKWAFKRQPSVMTYACPAWELPADAYLLELQGLQNKVLRIT